MVDIISQQAQIATKLLIKGEVIAAPTNTVFGLICSDAGLDEMYRLKERPRTQPFQMLFSSVTDAMRYVVNSDILQEVIGGHDISKTTIVANGKCGKSVGFRIITSGIMGEILQRFDYLYASSANKRGQEVLQSSAAVREVFTDIYICDGVCGGVASTIIDITGGKIKIIRQGEVNI